MTTATTARAEYLKAADRFTTAVDATTLARWGEDAADTSQLSALTAEADAITEAARQLALLLPPSAIDIVTIEGVIRDLEGATIDIAYGGAFGIAGNARMLVVRARPDPAIGQTIIEGIVRL